MFLLVAGLVACFIWGAAVSIVLRVPVLSPTTPLMGLALIGSAEWWLLDILDLPIRVTAWPLAAVTALLVALCLRNRAWVRRRPERRDVSLISCAFVATVPMYLWNYQDSLIGSLPRPATIFNNDLPFYALAGQHVLESNFAEPGIIVGADLGSQAHNDVSGVFMLLATLSRLTGLSVADVIMPVLLLGVFLCVYALGFLLRTVSGLSSPIAALAAALACSGSIFYYGVAQGFVSQFYGMAAVFVSLAVVWGAEAAREQDAGSRRPSLSTIAQLAGLQIVLLFFYPHLAFLGLALIVGGPLLAACLTARRSREAAQALLRFGGVAVAALLLAMAVVPTRAFVAFQRTFSLRDITAGWVLDGVTIPDALGLAPFPGKPGPGELAPTAPFAPGKYLVSHGVGLRVAALAAVLLCVLIAVRRLARPGRCDPRTARLLALAVVAVGTYGAVYAYYGPSYQQWKWALFVQPLLAGALACLVFLAARRFVLRAPSGDATLSSRGGLLIVSIGLALIALQLFLGGSHRDHELKVDDALRGMPDRADLKRLRTVNLSFGGAARPWDTMWAALFSPAERNILLTPSYFPVGSPDADAPTVGRTQREQPVLVFPPASSVPKP